MYHSGVCLLYTSTAGVDSNNNSYSHKVYIQYTHETPSLGLDTSMIFYARRTLFFLRSSDPNIELSEIQTA